MAQNTLDLGMPGLAHDEQLVALANKFLGCKMDFLDVGARGVDDIEATCARLIDHLGNDAVGSDDDGAAPCLIEGIREVYALSFELSDHDRVVDQGAEGMDGGALRILARPEGHIQGALYSITGPGVGRDLDRRRGGHG